MEKFFKSFLAGISFWVGIVAVLAFSWGVAVYASATWGALPNATTGTPVSSTAWNDIVSQVNMLANGSGSLGVGQTWQDVSASRSFWTAYTNNTGKPILVSVSISGGWSVQAWFQINGVRMQAIDAAPGYLGTIVPPGAQYKVENWGASILYWYELR